MTHKQRSGIRAADVPGDLSIKMKRAAKLPRRSRLVSLFEEASVEEDDDADFIRLWLEGGAGAQTLAQIQSGMTSTVRYQACPRYALLGHVADGRAVVTASV